MVSYFLSKSHMSCCNPVSALKNIVKTFFKDSFVARSGSGMIIEKSDSDPDPEKIILEPQYCQLFDGGEGGPVYFVSSFSLLCKTICKFYLHCF